MDGSHLSLPGVELVPCEALRLVPGRGRRGNMTLDGEVIPWRPTHAQVRRVVHAGMDSRLDRSVAYSSDLTDVSVVTLCFIVLRFSKEKQMFSSDSLLRNAHIIQGRQTKYLAPFHNI